MCNFQGSGRIPGFANYYCSRVASLRPTEKLNVQCRVRARGGPTFRSARLSSGGKPSDKGAPLNVPLEINCIPVM